MADTVRYLMEEMIPELEEMVSKGYFTRSEIKVVAQKRQDFEYALKRRAALKKDYLRYIEHERKLEELRRHRKKARGIKGKKGLSEVGIVRRVHFIYERACRKFKADLSLWLDWLAFCKRSKSNKQFSKVVTKALHRHSHVAALWIEAAAWEFEHTSNVAAARALMQQGLRHCPRDESLWAEYLRLELLYVARLRARREVLGLPNPGEAEAEAPAQPAVKRKRKRATADDTAEPDADAPADAAAADDAAAAGGDADAAVRRVLTGAVARVVIKGALSAAPDSLSLRARLLRVLRDFTFPGVQSLQQFIYDRVMSDFASADSPAAQDASKQQLREDAWDLLARRHWPEGFDATRSADTTHLAPPPAFLHADQQDSRTDTDTAMHDAHAADPTEQHQQGLSGTGRWHVDSTSHTQCCETYQQALATVPTCRMHALYMRYLAQRVRRLLQPAAGGDEEAIRQLGSIGAQLLAGYAAAYDARLIDEAMCAQWVDWALALNQPKVAVLAAKVACEVVCPHGADVWLRRVRLERELHRRGQRTDEQLGATLRAAVAAVDTTATDAAPLWQAVLAAAPPGHAQHTALLQALLARLAGQARGPLHGGLGTVVSHLLRTVHQTQGITESRALTHKLLLLPPSGGDWFHAALDVELGELARLRTAGEGPRGKVVKDTEACVLRLFEAAVSAYGSVDVELWLRYAEYMAQAAKGPGSVYWRATKALDEPQVFVDEYRAKVGLV